MRVLGVLMGVVLGCGVAHAATPLASSGRALVEEPSISARTTALAEHESTSRSPQWILSLPEGGFTHSPARLSRAYKVDTTALLLVDRVR